MSTFEAWPKIPRWNREIVITEKIDGTNAAIIIEPVSPVSPPGNADYALAYVPDSETEGFRVYAQSRTRLIRPGADNYGFAAWVKEHADRLVALLGPGRHFGEWYGAGIQRGYGLDHKRFALFNVGRWSPEDTLGSGLPVDVVPILGRAGSPSEMAYLGFDEYEPEIMAVLHGLARSGSALVPGFMKPEGVVLFHTASRQTYKVLLEGDDVPKGKAA